MNEDLFHIGVEDLSLAYYREQVLVCLFRGSRQCVSEWYYWNDLNLPVEQYMATSVYRYVKK